MFTQVEKHKAVSYKMYVKTYKAGCEAPSSLQNIQETIKSINSAWLRIVWSDSDLHN